MTHRVFIYGTLKKNHRNHEKYMHGTRYICETSTVSHSFVMHAFNSVTSPGNYSPGVYKPTDKNGLKISGELYEVNDDTLTTLDELEGVGENYNRETVKLENDMTAYIYVKIQQPKHPTINNNHRILKSDTYYKWHDPI